jgi:GxxExxY protein
LPLPIVYKDVRLDLGYRLDLVVEETVIVELKCVRSLEPIHEAQLLTYLRLSGKKVGLLINFNSAVLRDGILRRIL